MRLDLTDITLVVDRSGSMQNIRVDAEGGINAFINDQKSKPGEANITLVQFDTEYDFVMNGIPLKDAPHYTLSPRGGTALLDAVGRAINEAGVRLAAIPESDRPGGVVFVIVTDGQENSSREFTLLKVREMVDTQRDTYKWQFVFLGAGPDTFAAGSALGFASHQIAGWQGHNVAAAYQQTSGLVGRMRSAGASGQSMSCGYTPGERKAMDDNA